MMFVQTMTSTHTDARNTDMQTYREVNMQTTLPFEYGEGEEEEEDQNEKKERQQPVAALWYEIWLKHCLPTSFR